MSCVSFLLPMACVRCVAFGGEHAQAVPPPASAEVGGVGVARAPELPGEVEQGAEQGGAVVVQQLHQVRLEDEAAQLNQVPGALPPCLGPIARVGAGAGGIEAVTHHHQPP